MLLTVYSPFSAIHSSSVISHLSRARFGQQPLESCVSTMSGLLEITHGNSRSIYDVKYIVHLLRHRASCLRGPPCWVSFCHPTRQTFLSCPATTWPTHCYSASPTLTQISAARALFTVSSSLHSCQLPRSSTRSPVSRVSSPTA